MTRHTFVCLDGHTCGNPVRLVTGGAIPHLVGDSMFAKRQHFLDVHDWIRTSLMFEPRGHDMMSGSILYPPTRDDCDVGVLFIETSGCLPMCGHGTIGTVTMAIENGLVAPATPGVLNLDTPAGRVVATYTMDGDRVARVALTNVPAYLDRTGLEVDAGGITIVCDVAYGGNFYAIVEARAADYTDLADYAPDDLIRWSRTIRDNLNRDYAWAHPTNADINRVSHVLWTGAPTKPHADARNAVVYGDKAIDRSPCGTGTSARMAQLHARGELAVGKPFVHESIIGSEFIGSVVETAEVGGRPGIIPSISGWAVQTGHNIITVDRADPYWEGFQVI